MAARGWGRGTGRSRRGLGGQRALTRDGRGGGPGRSPVPPPPPPTTGRQRAAAAATTDGRDPTRARARAPERETRPGEGRRSLVDTPRHRRAGGGGRHGWEAAAGLGSASTPGRGTGAAAGREEGHQTAQRRGTRRRKQEKQRGGKDRGPPRGGSGTLQRCLKARGRPPGHTGSHRPRPPAQGRSHGTRGHRPGPRRALATSRGSGRNHHATVTTGPENALPHAQRRQPPPHTPCSTSDPRAASPPHEGPRALRPGTTAPPPPHTKPLAAGEGTTPNSGEAGFGPGRADRGHDTPSAIWSRRAQRGGGGGPVATGRGRTAGEGSGARGGSGSGEGCAPTEARTGPPGKRARDPTATSMRAVPRRPGRQPASAPLAGPPPPRTRPHHGWDPNPT